MLSKVFVEVKLFDLLVSCSSELEQQIYTEHLCLGGLVAWADQEHYYLQYQ
jgi:hypothetical protein